MGEEIAADPLAGFIEGLRCQAQPAVAEQSNGAVAQLVPFQQHENHEHGHQQNLEQRFQQRPDNRRELPHPRGKPARLDRDQHGLTGSLRRRRVGGHVAEQLLELPADLVQRGVLAHLKILDPFLEVALIARQLAGEFLDLPRDGPADGGDQHKRQRGQRHDRDDPAQAEALERAVHGAEQKGQQDRQRHRNQHRARPVHRGDDQQQRADHDQR